MIKTKAYKTKKTAKSSKSQNQELHKKSELTKTKLGPNKKLTRKTKLTRSITLQNVENKNELECRERSSYVLSLFFSGIINSYIEMKALRSISTDAKVLYEHIKSLERFDIQVRPEELNKFLMRAKNSILKPKTVSGVWTLDSTNHSSEIFKGMHPSELTADKAFKKEIVPHWRKTFKLIQKIFKDGIGSYGFSEKMNLFFIDLNHQNPDLLKVLGYKGGDITLKNLERLGEKIK